MQIRFNLKLCVYSLGDVWTFDFYPLNLILVSWDGLNSLQDKGYQKSIEQRVLDDPFHIERPGWVILVPWLMET